MGPAGVPGLGYGGGAAPPWPSAGVGGLGIPMGAMGAFGAPPLPPGLPGYNPPGAGSGAADPRAGQDGRDRRDGGQPRNPGGGAQDRQPKQPMSYADELRLQMEQSKARKEAERRAQESPPPPGSPDRSPEAARRQMGSPIPGGDGTGPADQKSRDDAAKKKQLSYQDVLREQVEEKKRKQKEEKEKEKLEEQKEAERIVEEQKKLKQRFQAEQKKQQEKDERIKAENEERRLEAEKKRQFAAQKEKEQDEKFEAQRQQKSPTRDHAASPGHAAAAAASPSAAAAAAAPSPTRFDRAESPPIPTRRKRMTDLEDDPFNLKNKTKWAQAGGPPPVTHEWAEENGSPNARQAPPPSPPIQTLANAQGQQEPAVPLTSGTQPPSPPIPTLANNAGSQASQAAAAATSPAPAPAPAPEHSNSMAPTAPNTSRAPSPPLPTHAAQQQQQQQTTGAPLSTTQTLTNTSDPRQPGAVQPRVAGADSLERQLQMFETDDVAPTPRPPPGRPGSGPRRAVKSRGVEDMGEAFLERREPTVELEDLASADLHDSVHESSPIHSLHPPGSASLLSRSNGEAANFQDLGTKDPGTFGKTTATTELMDQLSALRKRLEGEQRRVDTQLKAGDAQYSKLADQSRRRKEQQVRVDEADDVVGQVLAQLKDVQGDIGGDLPAGDAPTQEAAIGAVFVKGGANVAPPPDDGVLSRFNQIKYNQVDGTDGTPSAQSALINAFPEPPNTDNALDVQQRAMIQAQERELELLRGRLGTTLDRNGTLASLASTGSFNLDIVTAKNEERLRRLNATTSAPAPGTSSDILESFLNESVVRGLGGSMFAPKLHNPTAIGELNAESSYRIRD